MATDINDLANEINEYLREFANGVGEKVEEAAKKTARQAVKELKSTSPVREHNGGTYAKGWRAKQLDDGTWVVYNGKSPQFTHLLENGHALVNGGRSRRIEHIKPVEQKAIKNFMKLVEEEILG